MGTTVETGDRGGLLLAAAEDSIELRLLRGFMLLREARPVRLPLGAQRVLSYLALHERPVPRHTVAGALWLDTSCARANANLRSALWRLNLPGLPLVVSDGGVLFLHPSLVVDLHQVDHLARDVLDHHVPVERPSEPTRLLSGDLLPDWEDSWAVVERERFRQLRLHALDSWCEQLTSGGHYGQAVDAGLAAVAAEPLRESGHRAVIAAYLAEGNTADAVRQFRLYQQLAGAELNAEPSERMRSLFTTAEIARAPHG